MKCRIRIYTVFFLLALLLCLATASGFGKAAECRLTERTWYIQNAYVIDYEISVDGPYVQGECNNNTSSSCYYTFVYTERTGSGWKVGVDSPWLTVSSSIYNERVTQRTYPYTVPPSTLAIFKVSYEERWDLYKGEVIQRAWCTECNKFHYYSEGISHECYWSLRTNNSVEHSPAWL